jgi:hypothetical protein
MESRFQIINIVSTSGASFFDHNYCQDDGVINDITFSGTTYFILNNLKNASIGLGDGGSTGFVSSPVLQTWVSVSFMLNIIRNNYITQSTLTNVFIHNGDSVTLCGATLVSPTRGNITLSGKGVFNAGSFDLDIAITFGASGIGQLGTYILPSLLGLGYVRTGYMYGSGLTTSGSPTIALGITGNNTALISATATSGINSTLVTVPSSVVAFPSTGVWGSANMTIAVGAITAGTLFIHLDCFCL